jgi:hypothetical protein
VLRERRRVLGSRELAGVEEARDDAEGLASIDERGLGCRVRLSAPRTENMFEYDNP